MITNVIMVFILFSLAGILLWGIKIHSGSDHFFDKQNNNAIRGFWCLIVILVHVPYAYQNRIQDMLGSFAYIGVTYYFMSSAYGLSLCVRNNPDSIKRFWRIRLPKLLIPYFLVNIIKVIFDCLEKKEISFASIVIINGWIRWLLVCYLIFWIAHKFVRECYQDTFIYMLIVVFSASVYVLKNHGIIINTTWCPEIFGFVWGIALFKYKNKIIGFSQNYWYVKSLLICLLSGALGLLYLRSKYVLFFGDYILKIVLGLAIILFMLILNTRISIGNRINAFLGNISYEIFLSHGLVFGLIGYLMPKIESGQFILLSIVLTIMISQCVHKFYINICKKQ